MLAVLRSAVAWQRKAVGGVGSTVALCFLSLLLLAHALLLYPGADVILRYGRGLRAWLERHEVRVADYIALVSAVATVGAVVVALWLARADRRRSESASKQRAQLAAARVASQLRLTYAWVASAQASGVFLPLELGDDMARLVALARVAKQVREPVYRIDHAMLVDLTALPNNCAHRIARAFDYIDSVRWQVDRFPAGQLLKLTNASQRADLLKSWTAALGAAHDLLRVALAECATATELGAPLPNAFELHGEPIELDV